MLKPDRIVLTNEIIKLANLPQNKNTKGYFTRHQLLELSVFIRKLIEEIGDMNEKRS